MKEHLRTYFYGPSTNSTTTDSSHRARPDDRRHSHQPLRRDGFPEGPVPPKLIRDTFNLTDTQINAALTYIEEHQIQVEAEYQEVIQTREEIRQYWEEHNRDRFARIAATPLTPEQDALWAKLQAQKASRLAGQN